MSMCSPGQSSRHLDIKGGMATQRGPGAGRERCWNVFGESEIRLRNQVAATGSVRMEDIPQARPKVAGFNAR